MNYSFPFKSGTKVIQHGDSFSQTWVSSLFSCVSIKRISLFSALFSLSSYRIVPERGWTWWKSPDVLGAVWIVVYRCFWSSFVSSGFETWCIVDFLFFDSRLSQLHTCSYRLWCGISAFYRRYCGWTRRSCRSSDLCSLYGLVSLVV